MNDKNGSLLKNEQAIDYKFSMLALLLSLRIKWYTEVLMKWNMKLMLIKG